MFEKVQVSFIDTGLILLVLIQYGVFIFDIKRPIVS